MKAIVIRGHGGPEVVSHEDLPDPSPGPGQVAIAVRAAALNQLSVLGSTMGTAAELVQVLRFVGEGKLRPVVDRVLPLGEARAAQGLLAERAQFGKIVLRP